jgi:hypothetical protein
VAGSVVIDGQQAGLVAEMQLLVLLYAFLNVPPSR